MMRGLFVSVVLLGVPALGQGQACLGAPTVDGQFAVAGTIGLTDGAKSYGGDVIANLRGPLSLGAGYSLIDVDDVETRGNSFGAVAAYEVSVPSVSLCPTAGVGYNRFHEEEFGIEGTVNQFVIPVGVGVGKRFAAGSSGFVTLFAQPQFLWIRTEGELSLGGGTFSNTESDSEFGIDLGGRYGTSAFYAGAAVGLTSIENSDPVFTFSVGLLLGRR